MEQETEMVEKRNRIISLLIAVALLFVIVHCSIYVVAETNHCCVGKKCLVCYQIEICKSTLKEISVALSAVSVAVTLIYTLWKHISLSRENAQSFTLVSCKVKLTD